MVGVISARRSKDPPLTKELARWCDYCTLWSVNFLLKDSFYHLAGLYEYYICTMEPAWEGIFDGDHWVEVWFFTGEYYARMASIRRHLPMFTMAKATLTKWIRPSNKGTAMKNRAFTLFELLAVIAILAILASLLLILGQGKVGGSAQSGLRQ